jgi:N utilization substance protein A
MAQAGISANRLELLQIADAVAREKSIDRKIVIAAMEDAIQKAAKSRYGAENDIRCEIDPKTGETKLTRVLQVVDTVENDSTQVTLAEAARRNPDAKVGDLIAEALPPLDFGRVAAQNAKQVIVQKVREAERERQFGEYKDRVGEIGNGTVKRVEYGNVIVDLGRAEGIVRRDEMIPRENVRLGDRIRAYIYDVRREQRGPQIFLSRARPEFMSKLFAQEVPEIYDGIVQIKSVAARGPRLQSSRRIPRSTQSARAWACAASACRRWWASCRARRSTSSSGIKTPPPSSSTRWLPPRSPRWSWTRTPTASRWWCRRASSRSP